MTDMKARMGILETSANRRTTNFSPRNVIAIAIRRFFCRRQPVSVACLIIQVVLEVFAHDTAPAAAVPTPSTPVCTGTRLTAAIPVFPLKASIKQRLLVDQNNVPFLLIGDSPQTLIGNLSETDAAAYMANRQKYGVNALWIDLLCNFSDGCDTHARTFDGIGPFTVDEDLSTPNPAYFQRADNMIGMAAGFGMAVLLDPIETSSWLGTLRTNGIPKAFAYGQYLGRRYRSFPNIVWLHGNDFQSWRNAADDALVLAVARGIVSVDPNHIHTVELNYLSSGSLDDPAWDPLVQLDAAYTYYPAYAQVLLEYNRSSFRPVLMLESNYEFEHIPGTDGGSLQNLRKQEYWTMLSGATGQVYGSFYTWRFPKDWATNLDTKGIVQLQLMHDVFASRSWFNLVPDQGHEVVTAGYDGLSGLLGRISVYAENGPRLVKRVFGLIHRVFSLGTIRLNTYATAARSSDGSLVMVYVPTARTITINMSKLSSPAAAHWFDPSSGRCVDAAGSPFPNSGYRELATPGVNGGGGDGDWLLILEALPTN
jgi:hypothetical protein